MLQELNELRKRLKPHRGITTSISCNECTDYFVANTSGKKSGLLDIWRSFPLLCTYFVCVIFGYRIWYEFVFYKISQETKVRLYKCIGVSGDNLRAKRGECDKDAQDNFSMYLKATDKKGTIYH